MATESEESLSLEPPRSATTNSTSDVSCPACPQQVKLPGYDDVFPIARLACARLGPRSWLWATPPQLETLIGELQDVPERYLQAAEQLFGPCPWTSLNLLVMSASFPEDFAVVSETACVSPCVLTGGRSLLHILTHVVAYAWFGRFQRSAADCSGASWLPAGLLAFARRRLLAKMHGEEVASLEAHLGQRCRLRYRSEPSATENGAADGKKADLEGKAHLSACERGFAFFAHLQHCASIDGDDEAFYRWLMQFCSAAQSNTLVAEDMLTSFFAAFPPCQESLKPEIIASWLSGAEPPWLPDCRDQAKSSTTPVDKIVHAWEMIVPTEVLGGNEDKTTKLILRTAVHVKLRWNFYQVLYLLESFEATQAVYRSSILKLGDAYGFNTSANAEVLARWCRLLIRHNCQDHLPVVRSFLLAQGAPKYTLPIYRSLVERAKQEVKWKWIAKDLWEKATDHLDTAVKSEVEAILGRAQCLGVF
mmetsp:Transcript_68127/g.121407  ORF Transcript_68127/g.121407 Transcript_68127/m.121407 type:complete len:477 (+) Transcript_68127:59-1489(+)